MRLRLHAVVVVVTVAVLGLAVREAPAARGEADGPVPVLRLVVMPVLDLTGSVAPSASVEARILDRVEAAGFDVVPSGDLDAWFAEHRVRYTGGLSAERLATLAERSGARAVLFTTVDQYVDDDPPRVALTARAVDPATGRIVWTRQVARSGRDRPGILELGVLHDVERLADDAVRELLGDLRPGLLDGRLRSGAAGFEDDRPGVRRAHRPQRAFRAPGLTFEGGPPPRVAVLPFFNGSDRADAGSLAANLYVHELAGTPEVEVLDPGIVRDGLLRGRLIQDQGLSLAQIGLVREMLGADLIVTGRVLTYVEPGGDGIPRVAFSVWVFDTRSREVVWSAYSAGSGRDGVVFFENGRAWSARALLAGMIRASARAFLERR